MSRMMKALKVLEDYAGNGNPVIGAEFRPGRGWTRTNFRKRASAAWLRRLRREGVTVVGIELEESGILADFSVEEILKGGFAR